MRNLLTALLTTGALLGVAGSASAGTATSNFTVTATVNTNCKVSAAPLTFTYVPGGGAVTNNTTVTVNCTKNTPFDTALTAGATAGSTVALRLLSDTSGNKLQYNLYSSATFITPWGATVGTDTLHGIGGGMGVPQAVIQTVYGQVVDGTTNQGLPPGTYTDTITVNVTY